MDKSKVVRITPAILDYDGKWRINESYRPIAEALVAKYPELQHIPVDKILFLDNVEGKPKPKRKGKYILAQIGLVPDRWEQIVIQLSGVDIWYVMEIFKKHVKGLSPTQITALIYHELRHIGREGGIIDHDITDWWNMVDRLGPGWNRPETPVPDLLAEGVDWSTITRRPLVEEPGPEPEDEAEEEAAEEEDEAADDIATVTKFLPAPENRPRWRTPASAPSKGGDSHG